MYYFRAYYTNMDTEEETSREIVFDGQFFNSEKECYIYAMGKAFDLCKKNESFDSIEFIAC